MIELYETEVEISMEDYYEKNKQKLNQEGNLLVEGVLQFNKGNEKTDFPAFVAKDGMVVPKDWDDVTEKVINGMPGTEMHFIVNDKKHVVFYDSTCEWLTANVPGVDFRQEFVEQIKELMKEKNMAHLMANLKPGEFAEVVNVFMGSFAEDEQKYQSKMKP